MKIIVCFRHLKCICRKWRRGMDYSWHVQHLLREIGCGQFAHPRSVAGVSAGRDPLVRAIELLAASNDYAEVR
jgi:hypothetical protein